METLTADSCQLKELFKQAIVEAMEDLVMIHAIQEGEETEPASREEIFKVLIDNRRSAAGSTKNLA